MADMNHVPEEVVEKIFSSLCPYLDYKNCALVCSKWRRLIHGVAHRKRKIFTSAIKRGRVIWTAHYKQPGIATFSDRYLHSSCHVGGSLYAFGGCTASFTTFNDLWRLDLSGKQWIRPVASGTYPSPKACASMVVWRDELLLFGGWSPPTPLLPHQQPLFFNQLHFYNTQFNTWTVISPERSPKPVAGHCACVLNDRMVVFGGSQQHSTNTNEVWVFDILSHSWREYETTEDKPLPRYGAFMCAVSDNQAIMLGGCGGANMKFKDTWLLTFTDTDTIRWTELVAHNTDTNCPSQLWCHPACQVDNSIVCLSKTTIPIEQEILHRISQSKAMRQISTTARHSSTSYSSSSSDDEEVRTRSNMAAARGAASNMRNHQQRRARQLELLEKFEKKLRTAQKPEAERSQEPNLLKRPMFLHSLDISTVSDGYVTWREPNLTDVYGEVSEETHYYTLTEGRGELVLVGGTHEIEQGMQRGATPTSQSLNDVVYTITALDNDT